MIDIPALRLPVEEEIEDVRALAADYLSCPVRNIRSAYIYRRSVDARKKPEIFYVYGIRADVEDPKKIRTRRPYERSEEKEYVLPERKAQPLHPPVIAGCGPAGLFCAYYLSLAGLAPILCERGDAIEERVKRVDSFHAGGPLDPESNVQFGEGGAGTFSDGKLTTRNKDREGRIRFILRTFTQFGAPEDILYEQYPHIGTDVLRSVLVRMRKGIEEAGGTILFRKRLDDIETAGGQVRAAVFADGMRMETDRIVLATGHSARDTLEMLSRRGVLMQPKAFAVGMRIEHPQEMVDRAQYGRERGSLPPAVYQLSSQGIRPVYTFCMCPGGSVINASSEPGMLAVNGQSRRARDGRNANSAVVAAVTPEDYAGYAANDPALAGAAFQRELERKAYLLADGAVPVTTAAGFAAGEGRRPEGVIPDIAGRYACADLRKIFPEGYAEAILAGIRDFGRRLAGFDRQDAVLSAVESRTSSPVRVLRDHLMQSNIRGLYPAGEGAGYAGGIMSAAADGLKIAEVIAADYDL